MAGSTQSDDGEITGINVTPLVDIMLVLLIIFMVTATYVVKEAIEVQLPKAAAGGETTAKTLTVVVKKDGTYYLDGVPLTEAALRKKVADSPEKKEDMQAVITADSDALHGSVVHMFDVLKQEGITKFAIQTEKPTE